MLRVQSVINFSHLVDARDFDLPYEKLTKCNLIELQEISNCLTFSGVSTLSVTQLIMVVDRSRALERNLH